MMMTGDVVNGQSSCRCCVVFVVVEEVDVVGIVAVAVVVVGGGAVVVRAVVIGGDGDEASLTASCGDWCCLVSCGVVQNHRPGGCDHTHHSRLFVTKSRARNSNRS